MTKSDVCKTGQTYVRPQLMNYEFLRYFLPVYFLLYFFVLVVLKAMVVGKQIGKSPIVLTTDDSAFGLIGFYVKFAMLALVVYVIMFSVFPQWYRHFKPIMVLEHQRLKIAALVLSLASLVWMVVSQNHMRQSWRLGVDLQNKTELISDGVYKISRNPIYVGMLISIAALFIITTNMVTLLISALTIVLVQIQVRLGEEYLTKMHGQEFLNSKQKVRRWL